MAVLCNIEIQPSSILLNSIGQDYLVPLAHGHIGEIFLSTFFKKLLDLFFIADHQFGAVTLCLLKIGKFIEKTNVQKFKSH